MIIAVVTLGVVALGLLEYHYRETKAWASERQLLLERIQAPERVRVAEAPPRELEPLDLDDAQLARVGSIDYGDSDA